MKKTENETDRCMKSKLLQVFVGEQTFYSIILTVYKLFTFFLQFCRFLAYFRLQNTNFIQFIEIKTFCTVRHLEIIQLPVMHFGYTDSDVMGIILPYRQKIACVQPLENFLITKLEIKEFSSGCTQAILPLELEFLMVRLNNAELTTKRLQL